MSNNAYTHDAYETIHKSGNVSYVSQTTPNSVKTECEIPAPVKFVVPIIFVPGIMGSNLKDSKKNKVWYPKKSISTIVKYSRRDAMQRQIDLNPDTTEVGYDGDIKLNKKQLPYITEEIARARGWGSVITIGYAKVLIYLENQLNNPFKKLSEHQQEQFNGTAEWTKIVQPGTKETQDILKNWSSTKAVELLSLEQHEELADYAFPVFACGYNWLDSNKNSADKIADRLNNEVMAQVKKEYPTAKFKKFIVVTHSMGGLVTRVLIQNDKVKDKIAGVVHGVMPASGAPAVYQRLTVGWDGWKASTGLKNKVTAWATKFMFGNTSERLTAVLASAPGALELLPFANYSNAQDFPKNPKAWLILKANTPTGEITASLPQTADPYNEIYKRKDSWWAMINADFIDPAGIIADKIIKKGKYASIFDVYVNNIVVVRKLHDHIKDSYHSNTYAHYGADQEHQSFGQVVWRCQEVLNISSEQELIELMELYGKKNLIELPDIVKERKTAQSENTDKQADDSSGQEDNSSGQEDDTNVTVQGSKAHNLNENAYKKDGVREILLDEKSRISKTNKATFCLDIKPTSRGDGTVSYQSGQDVRANTRTPKATFMINGYEHSGSYDHEDVQLNTIYCIANIVDLMKKSAQDCK